MPQLFSFLCHHYFHLSRDSSFGSKYLRRNWVRSSTTIVSQFIYFSMRSVAFRMNCHEFLFNFSIVEKWFRNSQRRMELWAFSPIRAVFQLHKTNFVPKKCSECSFIKIAFLSKENDFWDAIITCSIYFPWHLCGGPTQCGT